MSLLPSKKYGHFFLSRKNHNFLTRWFVDPDIKSYRSFSVNPDKDAIPEESYNMWKEYPVKSIKEWNRKEGKRIVIKYLDFVHKLFGQDTQQTMFGLKWQAHPFQHPGEKPTVMACLLGPQGGGKTTFLTVSMDMMGAWHVTVANKQPLPASSIALHVPCTQNIHPSIKRAASCSAAALAGVRRHRQGRAKRL